MIRVSFLLPFIPVFPLQDSLCSAKLLMAGRVWSGPDPPVLSCLCSWTFLTGHLWNQGSGLPEFLVWSIKALSVISSIWLCLVRAVNKCDLLSATSQTEGSASALHQPLRAVVLVEQMKRRKIFQFLSLPWSSYQETLLEIVPLLECCCFSFLRSFAHVLPYSTCLQGMNLWAVHQGLTTTSVIFAPVSLFPHENCREWIASLSFLCISRAEKSNKDQTPQAVVLTEKKLVNIFVLCFSVFSSEFSYRSLERYLYMCHLIPEGVMFSGWLKGFEYMTSNTTV